MPFDTSIIAILAGSGGALTASVVFYRVYSEKVRKLTNGLAIRDRQLDEAANKFKLYQGWLDARDATIAELRASQERMAGNISRLAGERNDAIAKLSAAGQPDKQAISDWARQMQARSTAVRMAKRAGVLP